MFKTLNPFSAFNRKQIRDLEAELRGRNNSDKRAPDPVAPKAVRKPDSAA